MFAALDGARACTPPAALSAGGDLLEHQTHGRVHLAHRGHLLERERADVGVRQEPGGERGLAHLQDAPQPVGSPSSARPSLAGHYQNLARAAPLRVGELRVEMGV